MSTSMLVTDIETKIGYKNQAFITLRVESDVTLPLEEITKAIGETQLVRHAFALHDWDTLAEIARIVDTDEFIDDMAEQAFQYPPGAGAAHNSTPAQIAESDKYHDMLITRHRDTICRIEEAMRRIRERWEADDIDAAPADIGDQ